MGLPELQSLCAKEMEVWVTALGSLVPSGSHLTCTGTAETLELGIGEKLVQPGV